MLAWPKFVPTTASVSRKGTAIRGAYRGCPLRRPVVVNPSSGSPASRSTAVVRPPLSRATARSSIGRVWASARAPSGVDATARTPRCSRVGSPMR